MIDYLGRLARTGAAYTASSVLAKLIAVFTLPLYTRHMTPLQFGQAEVLGVGVIIASIFLRGGMIEALMRFHNHFADRKREVDRTAFWAITVFVLVGAAICVPLAPQIGDLLLRSHSPAALQLVHIAIFGLVMFTFYELLLAFFRLDEQAAAYAGATVANVLLTVPLTIWLVVFEDEGAKGYLLGNFVGTAAIVVALFWIQRRRIGRPGVPLARDMFRFGLPTMPAEISLYALNIADRILLINIPANRAAGLAFAGLYSVAAKLAQGVTIFVRGFQLAWPPLAYSIKDDEEASVVYGRILTYYLLLTSLPLTILALDARLVTKLIAGPEFFQSHRALPLLATGVTLYGAYLVMVTAVARTGKTGSMFPIAFTGIAVNVALCLLLIPNHNITGAGLALVGAYAVILSLMFLRARVAIHLQLEWRRLAQIVVCALVVVFSGEYLLPTSGVGSYVARLAWAGLYPLLLFATGFFSPGEKARLRNAHRLLQRARDSKALPDGPALVEQMHDRE